MNVEDFYWGDISPGFEERAKYRKQGFDFAEQHFRKEIVKHINYLENQKKLNSELNMQILVIHQEHQIECCRDLLERLKI
jgi:hypothetical protein